MSEKPGLLLFYPYMEIMAGGAAEHFDLLRWWKEPAPAEALIRKGHSIAAILTTGQDHVIDETLLHKLPNLKVIVAVGSGYAGVDVKAARTRGITVANAGDTHSGDVAEHAIALAFALIRDIIPGDRYVRNGDWLQKGYPAHHRAISDERFGILGLGRIGRAIAARLAPFGGEIAWWSPSPQSVPWSRRNSPIALAEWCSTLFVAARGDAVGLVDRGIIEAVGPDGYIVNISRGEVIDEDALIAALREGRLGGAGLDVFNDEPTDPDRWHEVPNTIFSPHMAGQTIGAMARLREAAAINLMTALDGGAVVNEILS